MKSSNIPNISKKFCAALSAAMLSLSIAACGSSGDTSVVESSEPAVAASSYEATENASVESANVSAPTESTQNTAADTSNLATEQAQSVDTTSSSSAAPETTSSSSAAPISANVVTEEEEPENTDVTAGEVDDSGTYSVDATVGEDVSFTVDAPENSADGDYENAEPLSEDKSGDSLRSARLAFYTAYEDGDRESAEDDLEDFEDIDAPYDWMMEDLRNYYGDLGKTFAQFKIKTYDFSQPAELEEDYVEFDVYTEDHKQFFLDVEFVEGKVSDIDFYYSDES